MPASAVDVIGVLYQDQDDIYCICPSCFDHKRMDDFIKRPENYTAVSMEELQMNKYENTSIHCNICGVVILD
jgi:hypothetical protein